MDRLKDWTIRHRADLLLSLRTVFAALLTFSLAHWLGLSQGYWAVLTSVIVMQSSVGGSLKASIDRLIGTVGGTVYGGAVVALLPHYGLTDTALTLACAVGPLALLAAINASFRIAPITAVIVLFSPVTGHDGAVTLAVSRVAEISLGCGIGLAVTLLILPARAHILVGAAAERVLDELATLVPSLIGGVSQATDPVEHYRRWEGVRAAFADLETMIGEAKRERKHHLAHAPDPEPLLRTLRRINNDLVMAGRATTLPFPVEVVAELAPALAALGGALADFLRAGGGALRAHLGAPPPDPLEAALDRYAAHIAGLRAGGSLRELPAETVGQIFTLSFALEQLRENLRDLGSRIEEMAAGASESRVS